jgi:6-pyruvoyltetrahydropterin/6-carboxytetrahydropterin synthase
MIVDFGIIKALVGTWIDQKWDHTAIFEKDDTDPAIIEIARSNEKYGKPVYFMNSPPTAENLAIELAQVTQTLLLEHRVELISVVIWETPNCKAEWRLQEN